VDGEQYLVKRQMPLQDIIVAENSAGEDVMLKKEQWELSQPLIKESPEKKKEKKKGK
jgi:frataxin-like iron-binding protein CyaY